jgi:hypothetical protein
MKTKLIIVSILFLFSGLSAEAQLLKKLKDAMQKGGKNTVERNEGKTDGQTTEDDIDGESGVSTSQNDMANGIPGMPMGEPIPASPDNNVKLPDSYRFSYRATMRIKNSEGTAERMFYLEPDAPYYARKQINKDLTEFLVLDNQNNMAVIFSEFEGKKRRIHDRINLQTKATLMGAYRDAPQKEPVKSIESKIILGYNCQGYQISTEAGTTELWITDEAPASLFSTLFAHRAENPGSPFSKNSMIMELTFSSANAPEKNYQMICTELHPETLVLNKTDYQEAL